MTEAVEIWRAACIAYGGVSIEDGEGEMLAARVIKEALRARDERIAELEERLRKSNEANWFYLGGDCSLEQCRFCIDECISEDFEWYNAPKGDHVLQISGARPVPDMWISLHYFTEAEMDERQDDEPYAYTVHATEEEARAALKEKNDDA